MDFIRSRGEKQGEYGMWESGAEEEEEEKTVGGGSTIGL